MNLSRREFSLLGGAGLIAFAGGTALPRPARAALRSPIGLRAQTYFKWQAIPGAGSAAAGFGEGGNTLIVWSKNEMLLVDTKNCPFGLPLRREAVAAATGAPAGAALRRVVNTHHHADHTGGNFAFTNDLPVLAHEKARARVLRQFERYTAAIKGAVAQMGRSDNPVAKDLITEFGELADRVEKGDIKAEQFAPTESMASEKELKIGDVNVVLRHAGAGHTDNDVFLHFPDLNLVHTGDLCFNKIHPFMDRPGGAESAGWINSLRRVIELCNDKTVVVPGHGELTDVAGLKEQVRYFEAARDEVAAAVKAGKTADEIKKLELADFKNYNAPERLAITLSAIYAEQAEKK